MNDNNQDKVGQYTYYAFISYKSKDEKWAKWLQNKLEQYRLPAAICKKNKDLPKKLKPIFRDNTDLGVCSLSEELRNNLSNSKYLIVVCSKLSAKSEWVGAEIEYFISLGRKDNIIPFIIDGQPYSNDDNECFHPVIKKYFPRKDENGENKEILGANVNEYGRSCKYIKAEKAAVRVIAKMHGLSFDELWQREKRRKIRRLAAFLLLCGVMASVTGFIYQSNLPEDISIELNEISFHNKNLPPLQNAEVTVYIDKDIRKDTIKTIDDKAVFANIPAKYIGKNIKISFSCEDYLAFDTNIVLQKNQSLNIYRDETMYGIIKIKLFSDENYEKPLANTVLYVDSIKCKTDNEGILFCKIPLSIQDTTYTISTQKGNKGIIIYPYRAGSIPLDYINY